MSRHGLTVTAAAPIPVLFNGGEAGAWRIEKTVAVRGEGLPNAPALAVHAVPLHAPPHTDSAWSLRGTTGHQRYVRRKESDALVALQPPLGRPESTCAALIPIRKSAAWWTLAQDERREIFEERSRHIELGLRYLPPVARRLYHCRELGEPFDFLTWFEFSPDDAALFDELLGLLRETEEWNYVEREVELRLRRA
jgi:chlorite dismutase